MNVWKIGGLVSLFVVLGLALFGGRTYVDLREARETVVFTQTELGNALGALMLARGESDSLRQVRGEVTVVYRDRVREVPPDTVLVGLPPACDECVARSRAQDVALAAAASVIREDSTLIEQQEQTIRGVTRSLLVADSSLTALRGQLDEASQRDGRRKILGIPLPEVFAGYGLSFPEGQVRHGPVLALGWKVAL